MSLKLLICSNETLGLGHLRRALRLSRFLEADLQDISILILTGSSMIHGFPLPPKVDLIKLPALSWQGGWVFNSKYLPLPFEEVKRLRERIILETALVYQPHLFLVDLFPPGIGGELLSTLRALKDGRRTALAFGLRDVRDEPGLVQARWQADHTISVLEEFYDEIWVYGCQSLYDPIKEYQLPDTVAQKVRFCGYLGTEQPAASREETRRELGIAGNRFVLVTVGGGGDGFPVLDAYLRALAVLPGKPGLFSLLVGGPDLPEAEQEVVRRRCEEMERVQPERPVKFIGFSHRLLEYMAAADLVVSMAGYNTLVEILALEKRALVIPRIRHNLEQLIRASLFERLGLIQMLHPDHLSPQSLAEGLLAAFDAAPPSWQRLRAVGFNLDGLHQVKTNILRLLGKRRLLQQPSR